MWIETSLTICAHTVALNYQQRRLFTPYITCKKGIIFFQFNGAHPYSSDMSKSSWVCGTSESKHSQRAAPLSSTRPRASYVQYVFHRLPDFEFHPSSAVPDEEAIHELEIVISFYSAFLFITAGAEPTGNAHTDNRAASADPLWLASHSEALLSFHSTFLYQMAKKHKLLLSCPKAVGW